MKKYILKFKYRFLLICFLILLRQLFLMKSNFLNADAITVLTNRNLHSFFEIILFFLQLIPNRRYNIAPPSGNVKIVKIQDSIAFGDLSDNSIDTAKIIIIK